MKLIILFYSFIALNFATAQASDIQVIIDGDVYTCAQGNTTVPSCKAEAKSLAKKFDVCLEAHGISEKPYCFNQTYTDEISNCDEITEQCNNTCLDAHGISEKSYCFHQCY